MIVKQGMKKLVAVCLAILMLALPGLASAEQVVMRSLEISDITASMNGATAMDLSGLTLRLSGVEQGDSLIGLLEVLGGDQSAVEAVVEYDGRWLTAQMEGISNAYGIPLEKLLESQGMDVEEQLALIGQEFFPLLSINGESMEQFLQREEEYQEALIELVKSWGASMQSRGEEEVTFPNGETVTLQMQDLVITSEMQKEFWKIALEFYMSKAMASQEIAGEWGTEDPEALAEEIVEELGGREIPVILGWDASGEYMQGTSNFLLGDETYGTDGDFACCVYPDGEKTSVELLLNFQPDQTIHAGEYLAISLKCSGIEEQDFFEVEMEIDGDFGMGTVEVECAAYLYPVGYEGREDAELYFDLFMDSAEDRGGITLKGKYTPADYETTDCDQWEGALRLLAEGEYVSMEGSYRQAGEQAEREYSAMEISVLAPSSYGGEINAYYEYDANRTPNAYGGEDIVGTLVLGGGETWVNGEIRMNVAVVDTPVDPQKLSFEDKNVINVMTMGSKETDELFQEAQMWWMQAFMKLLGEVPGLQSLMASTMQY